MTGGVFQGDNKWLQEAYSSAEEAFIVEEYFTDYLRKTSGGNTHLYLENIDVEFCSPEEHPRVVVNAQYLSNTLKVIVPDRNFSAKKKARIRHHYQLRFASALKESHRRTNLLLWKTFPADEQKRILAALLFEQKKRGRSDLPRS